MKKLCDEGFEVLLETGGSLDISRVDSRVKRIVDFKCPSSNMMKKNLWENVERLKSGDEVKFVIGTREDYEWSKQMIELHRLIERVHQRESFLCDSSDDDPPVLAAARPLHQFARLQPV